MKKIIYLAFAVLLSVSLQAQVDRSVQPKPGPAPKVNLGKPQSFELPNGLKVMVVENHKLPRVSFFLSLDNPPSLEGDLIGISDLTSALLGNGTSKIGKDEYNQKLDYYGASIVFRVGYVGGTTLSRYFPQVLGLVSQGVLDPLFTEEDLSKERVIALDALKSEEKSAQSIASRVRQTLVYGKNHPKGEAATEASINKVQLSDIQSYYKTRFVPQNAYMVVVGDVTLDEVKKLVIDDFASWKKTELPVSVYNEPVNLNATEINFVDVPNAVQSEISVNNVVTLKMTDSDYYAAILAGDILGGGANGRLFMNLREAHGWTYGSYSSISGDRRTTSFVASASVRNAVTDSAVVEILKEIELIRTTLPTQEELDLAKASMIGSFVMNVEKPETVARLSLKEKAQSLPADFYENYIKNIDAVTLEQVRDAAAKHILAQGTRIVVVGKASEVLTGLESLNIPIKYFDNYANPTTKPEEKVVDADVTVKSVLQKYIDAIGGQKALESVETIMYTAKSNIQGQELTMLKRETADGKSSQDMTVMGMTLLKSVFDGEKGYAEIQGNRQDMTADDIAELKYRGVFPELKMLNSETLVLDGIENIEGVDAYKLVDGDVAYFYAVDSGLKVGESLKKEVTPGQIVDQRGTYSDYKQVGDVKIPHKLAMNVGVEVVFTVEDVQLNTGVSADDFK